MQQSTTRSPARGITFRETMSGPFALGEADPASGARRGREQGTSLALHATVTIPDIASFVADPAHNGEIEGLVDFAPLGSGMRARGGRLQLFAPDGAPARKLMVYEVGFEHAGRPYYLAGRKEVRGGSPLAIWPHTTTLYTRLHEGGSSAGRVVGAGVLRLSVPAFAAQLGTMRPAGQGSAAGGLGALLAFGRFFAGEVLDSYGRPGRWRV
ncbi:MAG TPA: hypothetical protein VKA84_16660 [Gemmatimonadaceae bacterium]|nr:hypothetical protein [Gemmatimonadaceae bacterium]